MISVVSGRVRVIGKESDLARSLFDTAVSGVASLQLDASWSPSMRGLSEPERISFLSLIPSQYFKRIAAT